MHPLLPIHIAAGALSVLAGAAALILSKGQRAHRRAGSVFVAAMTVMAVTAAILGGDRGNFVAAQLTIYMIATGWVAARRKDYQAGKFEFAAFIVAFLVALSMVVGAALRALGIKAPENPYIVFVGFTIGAVVAFAAFADLSVFLRRGLPSAQRTARHLWRMCFGLVIAVGSFAAQGAAALPRAIPAPALLFGSMLLVLAVMAFWLVRVLVLRWRPRLDPAPASGQRVMEGGKS